MMERATSIWVSSPVNATMLAAVLSYLLGSIPFGLLLTRAAGLGDIRKIGSGSIGATNVLRTGRKGLAAATVLLDGGKGTLAVLLCAHFAGVPGVFFGGIAVVLGHLYPVWLKFRGGKGVATGFGVLIAAAPLISLVAGALWLLCAFTLRISSASALIASAAVPLLAWLLDAPQPVLGLSLVITALVYLRHKDNIARLLAGTEPRIGAKT
jgi:glycerol-3-phosphate acyltransferase PlsY